MKNVKQKLKWHNAHGFTLIELLVVVAIIGIMTVIMIASLKKGRAQRAVDIAARQVVATIRMAQGYALAGRYTDDNKIPCTFRFFVDASGEYGVRYTYHMQGSTCTLSPASVVSYHIGNGVTITPLSDVVFSIPQGIADRSARLTLRKGSATRSICIDKLGRVNDGC